jgi:hypothetical protein
MAFEVLRTPQVRDAAQKRMSRASAALRLCSTW